MEDFDIDQFRKATDLIAHASRVMVYGINRIDETRDDIETVVRAFYAA